MLNIITQLKKGCIAPFEVNEMVILFVFIMS